MRMVERWRWEPPRLLLSCLDLITFHLVIRIGNVKLLIEIFPHLPHYLWNGVLNLLVFIFIGSAAQPWNKNFLPCARRRIMLSNHSLGKLNFPELNMNKGIMKFSHHHHHCRRHIPLCEPIQGIIPSNRYSTFI